jgi:hypothetical protein
MRKIIALLAIMVFMVSSCGDDTNGEQTDKQAYYEQTHYDTLNITGQQVWLRNYSTNRLSQAYEKYNEEDHDIIILGEYDEEIGGYSEVIGSGSINRGKLSFAVNVPENLLKWNKLEVFFNIIVEGEGWDVDIDEDETRGTFIEMLTDDEDEYMLIKEGLSGTSSSISDETVFFIYVDRDCTITGESKEDERVMYTFNPFTMELRKGWNTIWYKQTYTSSGRATFSMDIKNPDLKWVMISTVQTM